MTCGFGSSKAPQFSCSAAEATCWRPPSVEMEPPQRFMIAPQCFLHFCFMSVTPRQAALLRHPQLEVVLTSRNSVSSRSRASAAAAAASAPAAASHAPCPRSPRLPSARWCEPAGACARIARAAPPSRDRRRCSAATVGSEPAAATAQAVAGIHLAQLARRAPLALQPARRLAPRSARGRLVPLRVARGGGDPRRQLAMGLARVVQPD